MLRLDVGMGVKERGFLVCRIEWMVGMGRVCGWGERETDTR